MNLEFNIGDVVTFNAYGTRIKAKVVSADMVTKQVSKNIEPEYELHGIDKPLLSKTSGRAIEESAYFIKPEGVN